jgi:hypothetical protein
MSSHAGQPALKISTVRFVAISMVLPRVRLGFFPLVPTERTPYKNQELLRQAMLR